MNGKEVILSVGLIFHADVSKTNTHHALRPMFYVLRTPLPWLLLALLPGLFYLAVSTWGFGFSGFPLDDAWIHQTYARNLAESGQLAFVPGVPSAGSTSPLWSLLLSGGYGLGLPFKGWTYGLGIIFLGLTGWTAARLGQKLFPESEWAGPAAGLFCVFEWHLVWAAVSGMETILFVWLSLFLMERYLAIASIEPNEATMSRYFGVGLLGGLLVLTRPEGLGLVGLIGLDGGIRWWRASERSANALLKRWLGLGLGLVVMVAPYVLFHLRLTGLPFPNTLYAKQAEYSVILSEFPLWWRLFGNFGPSLDSVQGVFRVIFIGAQVLLLPGLLCAAWLTFKERRWNLLPVWGWWIGHLLLYAVRLPVTYQHGRYQMPVIAWMIVVGVWGTARWVAPSSPKLKRNLFVRAGGKALVGSLVILVVAFTVVGAQAYGRDVRIIESEMVATARWLDQMVEPDALIAAHDIGAIGYFTRRPLIDLAGLITPEVIPIIRDETALFDFITSRQADYLVTFPSWYPAMTRQPSLKLIYRTEALWSAQAGGDNMVVYRIGQP
ncbi:MAG: hypothetical protein H6632_02160 [Anaerolineales bacterium]|nr:hypothetical protein [Anaerolineales bacterium]